MRFTAVTEQYPAAFKPYYDTQFVDLLRKGHQLTVLADEPFDESVNEKVREWALDRRTRYYPASLRTARRALRPGVLARLPAMLAKLPRDRRKPLRAARVAMLARSRPDAVLFHGLVPGMLFTGFRAALPGLRAGCYYHGGEPPNAPPVPRDEAVRVFDEVDVVFSNTRFSVQHAIDRGCPPDKIHVLPVGMAIDDYAGGDREPLAGRTLRILSAGRMSDEKGFIHALRALTLLEERGLRDLTYTLTGNGAYRRELESYVEEHGLGDRVRFIGTVSTRRVTREMGEADILLLPSLHLGNWAENQALAMQEAILMGAIPVTTATGGLPESVPAPLLRFQVPPADPRGIARAIEEIAGLPEAELVALREAGRRILRERYDIRALNDRMLELIAG